MERRRTRFKKKTKKTRLHLSEKVTAGGETPVPVRLHREGMHNGKAFSGENIGHKRRRFRSPKQKLILLKEQKREISSFSL